jgi:hypothetical protein
LLWWRQIREGLRHARVRRADAVADIDLGCDSGVGQPHDWHRFPSHRLSASTDFSFPKTSHRLILQAQSVLKTPNKMPGPEGQVHYATLLLEPGIHWRLIAGGKHEFITIERPCAGLDHAPPAGCL